MVQKHHVDEAITYINENSYPPANKSQKYDLIVNGQKYPPKYVIAVARSIANQNNIISINDFYTNDANKHLKRLGFLVSPKNDNFPQFELTITTETITSTEKDFTEDQLVVGKGYKGVDAYFENLKGKKIKCILKGKQHEESGQKLARLVFQLFGDQIEKLTSEERENFPIRKIKGGIITGIYLSEESFREKFGDAIFERECLKYQNRFYIRHWGVFSAILLAQTCLKLFGKKGDKFVVTYQKTNKAENQKKRNYNNLFSEKLVQSRNIIFHGAPGTGKTFLAKQIAADIISNGEVSDIKELDKSSQEQFEFVQFHPSYDYTDFVEGLRPVVSENKTVGFELQDGIFKAFVEKARKEYEKNSKDPKPYVFVIDEINRGEISKIFGELFFAIDPGYRGPDGSISTQYANLHENPAEKFYIPKNVYIIGTMNDIDRSVDSFDFAMRRRFRFIEIKAEDTAASMLKSLPKGKADEAMQRMKALNQVIAEIEDLGKNYQIGAAYFKKIADLNFDQLWTDYLAPLLSDYLRGLHNEKELMESFKNEYDGASDEKANDASPD